MNELIEKFHSIRSASGALTKEVESLDEYTKNTNIKFIILREKVFDLWYKHLERFRQAGLSVVKKREEAWITLYLDLKQAQGDLHFEILPVEPDTPESADVQIHFIGDASNQFVKGYFKKISERFFPDDKDESTDFYSSCDFPDAFQILDESILLALPEGADINPSDYNFAEDVVDDIHFYKEDVYYDIDQQYEILKRKDNELDSAYHKISEDLLKEWAKYLGSRKIGNIVFETDENGNSSISFIVEYQQTKIHISANTAMTFSMYSERISDVFIVVEVDHGTEFPSQLKEYLVTEYKNFVDTELSDVGCYLIDCNLPEGCDVLDQILNKMRGE